MDYRVFISNGDLIRDEYGNRLHSVLVALKPYAWLYYSIFHLRFLLFISAALVGTIYIRTPDKERTTVE